MTIDIQAIEALINEHHTKILSFDLFDTIIKRRCAHYKDIYYIMGESCYAENITSFKPQIFQQKRMKAEKLLAKSNGKIGNKSVSLPDIYKVMQKNSWIDKNIDIQTLVAMEYAIDQDYSFVSPEISAIIAMIKQKNLKLILTTNSFYNHAQITQFLASYQLDNLFDALYISSEQKCSKQNGLFDKIIHDYDCKAQQILHIGDNLKTDIEPAEKLGIQTYHVTEPNFYNSNKVSDINIRKQLGLWAAFMPENTNPYIQFGAKFLGPQLLGFSQFIHEQQQKYQSEHIIFVEREGIFFQKIYQNLYPENTNHSLLAVSRLSLGCLVYPFLPKAEQKELMDKIAHANGQIFPEQSAEIAKQKIMQLLSPYINYKNILMVDLGYKGTIQKYLEIAFKAIGCGSNIQGAYIIQAFPKDSPIKGDGYLDNYRKPYNLLKNMKGGICIYEQMMMPNLGSVVGYQNGDTLRDSIKAQDWQQEQQALIQKGAYEFCKHFAQIFSALNLQTDDFKDYLANGLLQLFKERNPNNKIFKNWQHEISFGAKYLINVVYPSNLPNKHFITNFHSWYGSISSKTIPNSLFKASYFTNINNSKTKHKELWQPDTENELIFTIEEFNQAQSFNITWSKRLKKLPKQIYYLPLNDYQYNGLENYFDWQDNLISISQDELQNLPSKDIESILFVVRLTPKKGFFGF